MLIVVVLVVVLTGASAVKLDVVVCLICVPLDPNIVGLTGTDPLVTPIVRNV